ncbi:MAG: archaetidylserine decarboxylase [Limnobacter sp.]|nr:archaetidylserine decarboxylase [Limnobacter sp.]
MASVLDDLSFLLTNRFPRLLVSSLMGVISRWEHRWFVKPALWVWNACANLNLHEAEKSEFTSIRDCFTRALKPGMRPIAKNATFVSPCDGILGAHGLIEKGTLLQIKGMPYQLSELLLDDEAAAQLEGYRYLTIRITASMYHRLHSPASLKIQGMRWITGDCWNVNPIALQRVQKLFCRNHRAVIFTELSTGETCVIVPVAAVLVGALRLHALGKVVDQHTAPFELKVNDQEADAGEELGWFEHGSTVVMLVPAHYRLAQGLQEGSGLKMGQVLMQRAP